MRWVIEYDNDAGANDEGFTEWWDVTNGDLRFKSHSEGGAIWLSGILNSVTRVSDEIDRCPRTGFVKRERQ